MISSRARTGRRTSPAEVRSRNGLTYMALIASHIAHELNSPLPNISLLVASARKLTNDPQVHDKLDRIDAIRLQCTAIIADVMALGRLRAPEVEDTDLRTLAHAALLQADPFRKRGVAADLRAGPVPVLAEVDPIQVQLVFTDLLKNAYQATERGSVTLSVSCHGDEVAIAVTDTGSGMTPEVRRRIFTPFFTTKRPGQGTGLGLTFCKNVVAAHRGRIRMASRLGVGSTFTIILPRRAAHADPGRGR